jgi:hypothetical protein
MANIRLQSILRQEVQKVTQDNGCDLSIAFIRLMLKNLFELDDFEIDEAITDGPGDKGIDAIFEQTDEDGNNTLYVVQSKYFVKNPEKTIDENAKNLVVSTISNYILRDNSLRDLNVKLQKKIEAIRPRLSDAQIDSIALFFFTNGQQPGQNIISELKQFESEQEGTISYQIITEGDLFSIFAPPSTYVVDSVELKIVKDSGSGERTTLNLPDIDTIQGKVFKVDVVDIAELVKNNLNIFSGNVRAFQSLKNKINSQIASTLRDNELIKEFIFLNNGITIVCDDFEVKPGGEIISLKKPSIINGCQTANTILEVYKEGLLQPNIGFVLARMVKTKDNGIKERIIKASNTQTAINNRDLISEEDIQKEIEAQFLQLGYYYERKRGLHSDKPYEKVIDLEKAAQCYLALYLDKPSEAKNKKSSIYTINYGKIFNDKLSAKQLLVGWLLLGKINKKIKELRRTASEERKSILGNSVMHLLPLFKEWAINSSGKTLSNIEENLDILNELFDDKIEEVIKKMEYAVNKIKERNEAFNPQYFFKSNDSLEKILKIKQEKQTIELTRRNVNKRDLRYYKPYEYTFDGQKFNKISHWNDFFVTLVEQYSQNMELKEGNLDFINPRSRSLLVTNPTEDEKKLRKRLSNNLWILTNFDSKSLSKFCFEIADKLNIDLKIHLRATPYRKENKFKK